MTEKEPGELFREIYSLPRAEQLNRIADETNNILTCDPDNLDYRLATLEYTIHVIRGALWDEDAARIRAHNLIRPPHHTIPPTLDDIA